MKHIVVALLLIALAVAVGLAVFSPSLAHAACFRTRSGVLVSCQQELPVDQHLPTMRQPHARHHLG